ncbi:hypothetical protein KC19_1G061200 [Ceratodon purpureus]|uniref:Uncharacterized protein n=1 Tax=Ceratodon purpureus TaxID=3225 RepID=A0A8T0J240_CERPU|nr:hypothetical protein KC19_1G061200 [Ceratodon purpureus]
MECRKVQEQASSDEYEVHVVVVGSSSSYQSLRFALLASSWLPLRLGILVWSVVHLLLVVVSILACVIFMLCSNPCFIYMLCFIILYYFFALPLMFFINALRDIVVLIIDTLRFIFVTIRVIVSGEATPGTATKVAYERIGGIRLFRRVIAFMIANHSVEELCRDPNERGEAQEPGMGPAEPRNTLEWQIKRWCKEIVPHYDVVS